MTWMNVELPLYEDEDFSYTVPLQDNTYTFRAYYNTRMQRWFMDLLKEDGTSIYSGIVLNLYSPLTSDYWYEDLTGFFWLQPKGNGTDESLVNPSELSKYYQLFYMWEE